MNPHFPALAAGLVVGFALARATGFLERRRALKKARLEGEDCLHQAEEAAEKQREAASFHLKNQERRIAEPFQAELRASKQKISELQSQTDKRAYTIRLKNAERARNAGRLQAESAALSKQNQELENRIQSLSARPAERKERLLQALESRFSLNREAIKKPIAKQTLEKFSAAAASRTEKWERDQESALEKTALFHLHCALCRFAAPYCPEKGIEKVSFHSLKHLKRTIGPDRAFLAGLETECGVDAAVHEEELSVSVMGIDPVRRELGRRVLKEMSRMRSLNPAFIKKLVEKTKKGLFQQIKRDGAAVCRRLNIEAPAPMRNMLGSLRYRYSFAQNQHFHCEEAGALCGLLSAEAGLSQEKGRRAGLFHDIGKAMDHSIEGNHAVIGADFIEKHGEAEDVTHAVRAHHHDVSPGTALAYLVIAADALSGARPGARRFTEDSYAKKMERLEAIAGSFQNIKDAYIMSAGREMRIVVDNKKVSDREALLLSRKAAEKIERECAYPGLIKVTVVRKSEVAAFVN